MRHLVAIILLVSILCQSFALAAQVGFRVAGTSAEEAALAFEHDVMHWEGISHHHDDDGVARLDDGPGSITHAHGDGGPHNALPWQLSPLALPALGSTLPPVLSFRARPHPHLDGPLRPPRSHA